MFTAKRSPEIHDLFNYFHATEFFLLIPAGHVILHGYVCLISHGQYVPVVLYKSHVFFPCGRFILLLSTMFVSYEWRGGVQHHATSHTLLHAVDSMLPPVTCHSVAALLPSAELVDM